MTHSAFLGLSALILTAALCTALTADPPESDGVIEMELPLKFPTVGNVDDVEEWHFGRLEDATWIPGNADIGLTIRTADGKSHRIVAPAAPLNDLARRSNWVATATKTTPTAKDYVERMIAFDVDDTGRLIAMMSLEPMDRNRRKLERVFGKR